MPRQSFRIFGIPMTLQLRLLDGAYDNLPANPQQLADLQADIRRESRWIRSGVSGTGIHAATTSTRPAFHTRLNASLDAALAAESASYPTMSVADDSFTSTSSACQYGVQDAAQMLQDYGSRPTLSPAESLHGRRRSDADVGFTAISCKSCGPVYNSY